MEHRFWLGIGVLGALLAISLTVTVAMSTIHEPGAREFSQAAQTAMAGDLDRARELAAHAQLRWQSSRSFTACVADHAPMDDVENLLAEMTVFAREGDAKHFAACCAQLAEAIRAMSEAHSPTWWNFL